ncbi:hypothetical protein LCGC14_2542750, partial [marine sediment metagenome]
MTSKQRILAAVAHRQPDRVPVMLHFAPEVELALREHLGLGPGIQIPLGVNLGGLQSLWPDLGRGPYVGIFSPTLFFAAVGLAFLVSWDVSLSVGISNIVSCVVFAVLIGAG